MKKGNYCPLIKKDCIEHKCAWYGLIRGVNPNTGQDVDEWNCAINFVPLLLIENSHKQAQTGAAIDSLRDESAKQNHSSSQMLIQVLRNAAILSQVQPAHVQLLDNPG
jgi:hypothetical protein